MIKNSFIYRYRSIEKLFKFNELENLEIYFSKPEELNDHTTGHYVGSISENDFYPEPYKWDGPKASWMNRGEE